MMGRSGSMIASLCSASQSSRGSAKSPLFDAGAVFAAIGLHSLISETLMLGFADHIRIGGVARASLSRGAGWPWSLGQRGPRQEHWAPHAALAANSASRSCTKDSKVFGLAPPIFSIVAVAA